jgi:hypothetical protein
MMGSRCLFVVNLTWNGKQQSLSWTSVWWHWDPVSSLSLSTPIPFSHSKFLKPRYLNLHEQNISESTKLHRPSVISLDVKFSHKPMRQQSKAWVLGPMVWDHLPAHFCDSVQVSKPMGGSVSTSIKLSLSKMQLHLQVVGTMKWDCWHKLFSL